jgi:hypothetical protein
MLRRTGLTLALLLAAAVGYIAVSGSKDEASGEPVAPGGQVAAAGVQVTCATGGPSPSRVRPKHDVVLGPLVLMGARRARDHPPDAFGGHGYKIPVSLPRGVTATVSVPRAARRRVGLVFTLDAQDRAWKRGVKGADPSVRFTACPPDATTRRRTGWPGGFVVDRRRCATLVLTVAGRTPERHRVPLGRRC